MKKLIISFLIFIIFLACNKNSENVLINEKGYANLIPKPVEVIQSGDIFTFYKKSKIYIETDYQEVLNIANSLAELLQKPTGYSFKIKKTPLIKRKGSIYLNIDSTNTDLGNEGYILEIIKNKIKIIALNPEGLYRGIQTLRLLLPLEIENDSILQNIWQIPTGYIKDYPRYKWRGAMLDVARHFFSVKDVKKYIDLLSIYKINRFHIHLTDDQGWRIEIKSWPKLTKIGSKSAVGGYPGGFYTQEEFKEIVNYATNKYITVIPEIDIPGHTNAALTSYAKLNCDGIARKPYYKMRVGFSSLCIHKNITYQFIDDVIREISIISPRKYFHIGGDEAHATTKEDYKVFVEKVKDILLKYNKIMVGWEEISQAEIDTGSLVQHWHSDYAKLAAKRGIKVIMSPAEKAYLDMKYDSTINLGLLWAGTSSIQDAYNWDPAEWMKEIYENNIIGLEAPLWSETITNIKELEYMAFPRVIGIAEIGWSQKENRNWQEYKQRLEYQYKRLDKLEVNYYKSN